MVVNLTEWRHRRALAVLEQLRRRVLAGDIRALAICAKGRDEQEQVSVLGDYRDDPSQGLAASMKISMDLLDFAVDQTQGR